MNSKLLAEFKAIGCKSRKDAAVALQVYIELCEVKRYYGVEYKYDEAIHRLYLTGKRSKNEDVSVFIPLAESEELSFSKMGHFINVATSLGLSNHSVYLVMCTPDSTCIFYQITDGIGDPPPVVPLLSKEVKMNRLDNELSRHRQTLEEAALHNLPVTIKKENVDEVMNVCSDNDEYDD